MIRRIFGKSGLKPAIDELLEVEREVPQQPDDVRQTAMRRARNVVARGGLALASNSQQSERALSPVRRIGGLLRVRPVYGAATVLVLAGFAGAAIGLSSSPPWQSQPVEPAFAPPTAVTSSGGAPPPTQLPSPVETAPSVEAQTESVDVPPPTEAKRADAARRVSDEAPQPPTSADEPKSNLKDELYLLQQARALVAQGRWSAALVELSAHGTEYPKSRLRQEREALRIKALWGRGDRDQARRAARSFRRRYPSSVFNSWLEQEVDRGSSP